MHVFQAPASRRYYRATSFPAIYISYTGNIEHIGDFNSNARFNALSVHQLRRVVVTPGVMTSHIAIVVGLSRRDAHTKHVHSWNRTRVGGMNEIALPSSPLVLGLVNTVVADDNDTLTPSCSLCMANSPSLINSSVMARIR